MQPSAGYALFARAEALNITVAKLLTGQDMPMGNMEMALTHTYQLAQQAIQKRNEKKR